nr:phosphoribosylpyrophosphate synthetase [Robiginitalea sp. SC105]
MQKQGYTENLNYCDSGLENKRKSCVYPASELDVNHFYRFEGETNPGDNTILYAIETSDGHKGLLVDAYGAYAGNIPRDIVQKLRIVR